MARKNKANATASVAVVATPAKKMTAQAVKTHALTFCYACGACATGLRDRRPEGGEIEMACPRHAEPGIRPVLCCMYCNEPTRKGSLVIDGDQAHAACHREACR